MTKARIRILSINLILLLAIGGAGFWGYTVLHPKAAVVTTQTATVTRGDVTSTVSATGKVISPSDIGLAPLVAGTLSKLYVKVGDHVSPGETLAQIDTTNLTTALTQANASLVSAHAAVAALVPTKTAAEQAQAALQLAQAQAALDLAKKNQADNTALTQSNAATYQATVDAAKKALDDATVNANLASSNYQASVDAAQRTLDLANVTLSNLIWTYTQTRVVDTVGLTLSVDFCSNTLPTLTLSTKDVTAFNTNCTPLVADSNAVVSAKISLANAKSSQAASLLKDQQNLAGLTTAYNNTVVTQRNNLAKDAVTISGYANSVQSAQNALDNLNASTNVSMQPAKQSAIDTAQAQLANAQASYDQATRNLEAATIKAPVAGDVASISTAVGGNVPTTSSPATISANATGFIVLTNVSSLEITGSFSESDAAKIKAGQAATFTFDALPNVTATGKVLGVDLLPTTSSGVTSYNATFALDAPVAGLKPGMTATPTVDVGLASGVIQVTAQAVTTRAGRSTVTVVTTVNGKEVLTPTRVVVGLIGDSADEIQSGLKEGDKVALPTVKATTSSNGFAVGGVPGALGSGIGGVAAVGGAGAGGRRNGG
jgi:multidrug efflux pump subunit AcrA (membrane-fusion protein)